MTNQPCFAALDVSLEKTSVYVMSHDGTILREVVVATDLDPIAACLALERLERIGLEAGPLSEWLDRGLADRGITAVLMETRQIRAALSARIVKTDRKDARGMAHLLRMGWFRPTIQLIANPTTTDVPDGTPGQGRWSGTSRWRPWRHNAVLEIGCPVPFLPHHVTITASITDRSMNPDRQAIPVLKTLIAHPQ